VDSGQWTVGEAFCLPLPPVLIAMGTLADWERGQKGLHKKSRLAAALCFELLTQIRS